MKSMSNGFGILIVAHGGLAREYLATLQHVIGQQERISAVSIEDSDDKSTKREEINQLVQNLDNGSGVVIVTDMFGGTPSNLAMPRGHDDKRKILYGINMPALIKLARLREEPIDDAIRHAVDAGHRYLNYCEKQG